MRVFFRYRMPVMAVLALVMVAGVSAHPMATKLPGLTPEQILSVVKDADTKTPQDVTVAERVALASAFSVSVQESMYVRRAAAASFFIPGAGQAMTGNYGAAAIHAGAELAIHIGGMAGLYYLLPADLRDMTMTHEERHAATAAYFTEERIGEILPAMGVAFGASTLSFINRVLASSGATNAALANLADGSVTFQPILGPSSVGVRVHRSLR